MKVIATKVGFFGSLREVGDKFEVPDSEKASWFSPVEPPEKSRATSNKQAATDKSDNT